ncbi:MAG: DNA polymerase III subunit alpha [Candidatus Colwellbacteria bacterium]|nr:DNA polymerase III subunit alpha [Candidatus Colwellbacteria bacterium]
MPKFVHLHTHSHYSLLDGLSKIDKLVLRAKELGMPALALTDHGNMYGAVEFYKKCKKEGVKPIIGVETYIAKNSRFGRDSKTDSTRYHLTLLVKNGVGYKNLNTLITKSHLEGFYYKPRIDKELLKEYSEGLICLSGCFSGEVARLLQANQVEVAERVAKEYKTIFKDDYYIEIQPHSPNLHKGLIAISKKLNIPLVATQDSHYLRPEDATMHEVFLAIQTNARFEDEDRFSFKKYNASLRPMEEMAELFKDLPEAIENTVKIADKCNFEFQLGKTILPHFDVPEGNDANSYLEKLLMEKLANRYPKAPQEVKDRLKYELSVIEKTGFADYFLIVQDFVNWAKERGIVVGPGRGSAAGSIISYILGITDVDPLKYNLLFERFLNPERISMPDIDLDFADTRRDEVLGYLKDKYGEDHVAQIITFGTMAARASVRDAGRALGMQYDFCDRIAKLIPFEPNMNKSDTRLDKYLEAVPELGQEYKTNPDAKKLINAARELEGTVRHASVHACGTVVSRESLVNYMPLQRSPQDEKATITQFEMHSVEDLGLLKIDLLGLRTLTIIEETLRLLKEMQGKDINITEIPLDDKKTYKYLQTGETTGVFQFESSGMRRYMKEIVPTTLEDLTALVSLYRPGPIELIPSFIARKFGREKVTYLHPKLEPILKTTHGIGVYQEQMMQIARDLAGFTLPEADTLRKAIGKKIKSLLDEQEKKLIDGMVKNGINDTTARKIWELFPPFARYGFNRSHAVSYALIGYQTAYLKAHYPVEFMTALLNNSKEDVERIALLVSEAKRIGIQVLPPDINMSAEKFVPEDSNIRFGIAAIKNVGKNITSVIVEERLRGGAYKSLEDFASRISHRDLNKKSLESLAKSGALDSFGIERNTILENMDNILKLKNGAKSANENQIGLFAHKPIEIKIKLKEAKPAAKMERLNWEKELLGLYITDHPLTGALSKIKGAEPISGVLTETNERKTHKIAGLITKIQYINTKNGDPMVFARIEDIGNNIEALIFSDVLKKDASIWTEGNIVGIAGRISRKNGEPKIICTAVKLIK